MKKLFLMALLPMALSARIEVAESDSISKKQLMDKIASTPKLIIKGYDGQEETGQHLDELYKDNNAVVLYKVDYNRLGAHTSSNKGKDNWAASFFGTGYDDLTTVYQVYRKGVKKLTVPVESITRPTTFVSRVNRVFAK